MAKRAAKDKPGSAEGASIWSNLRINALTEEQKRDWEATCWWDSLSAKDRQILFNGFRKMSGPRWDQHA